MHHFDQSLAGTRVIVTADGELHAEDTPENRDLARRLHACVNACAGISTEDLESGVIADMRRVIESVAPLLRDKRGDLERLVHPHGDARDAVA
jgi:hypothetical protein